MKLFFKIKSVFSFMPIRISLRTSSLFLMICVAVLFILGLLSCGTENDDLTSPNRGDNTSSVTPFEEMKIIDSLFAANGQSLKGDFFIQEEGEIDFSVFFKILSDVTLFETAVGVSIFVRNRGNSDDENLLYEGTIKLQNHAVVHANFTWEATKKGIYDIVVLVNKESEEFEFVFRSIMKADITMTSVINPEIYGDNTYGSFSTSGQLVTPSQEYFYSLEYVSNTILYDIDFFDFSEDQKYLSFSYLNNTLAWYLSYYYSPYDYNPYPILISDFYNQLNTKFVNWSSVDNLDYSSIDSDSKFNSEFITRGVDTNTNATYYSPSYYPVHSPSGTQTIFSKFLLYLDSNSSLRSSLENSETNSILSLDYYNPSNVYRETYKEDVLPSNGEDDFLAFTYLVGNAIIGIYNQDNLELISSYSDILTTNENYVDDSTLGDFNGDGAKDLLLLMRDGQVYLFLNQKKNKIFDFKNPSAHFNLNSVLGVNKIHFYRHQNQSGFVVAQDAGNIWWNVLHYPYKNGSFGEANLLESLPYDAEVVDFLIQDCDSNGSDDIVVLSRGKTTFLLQEEDAMYVYKTDVGYNATQNVQISENIVLYDFNDDGVVDIMKFATWQGAPSSTSLSLFYNQSFFKFQSLKTFGLTSDSISIKDAFVIQDTQVGDIEFDLILLGEDHYDNNRGNIYYKKLALDLTDD